MKGKKRASKRLTLKKKYKILRKVREHKRKVRKSDKTNKKKEKEPGIPNGYPFKAEALAALEQMKQHAEHEKELEKQQRAKFLQAKRQQAIEKQRKVQEELKLRQEKFELRGSKRKIYGRCRDVAEEADIIVEVLDARDPLGCISPEVEKWIRFNYPDKLFVRLLNKIDLVPKESVPRWLSYLRTEQPALAFKCPIKKKEKRTRRRLPVASEPIVHRLTPHMCLGLDNLVELCKNYATTFDDSRTVTVGIVGWPGVGKSSLLTQLKTLQDRTLTAEEGEDFHIATNVRILDYVGLVVPSSEVSPIELSLRGCIPADNVPNPFGAAEKILSRVSKEQMLETYKISMFENTREFLELVAKKGGKQSKGGKPDVTGAAKQVIKDWTLGKIKFFTEPPATSTSTATSAQGDWRAKVKMAELQAAEEAKIFPLLKSGTLQSFTSYGDAQLFNRKVEVKFLNFLEGREMEEEEANEDEMDEVNENGEDEDEDDDEEEDGEEEEVSSKKGKKVATTKSRKAKEAAKGAMALEGDFDFATDFVATSDVAGGVVDLDEDDDDDYEDDDDDEEEDGEEEEDSD